MSATRYCEGCGRQASADAAFCGGCGRALLAVEGVTTVSPQAPSGPVADGAECELFAFRPLIVRGFGELTLAIVTLGIAWLVLWLRRQWTRYRITSERIEITTGVLDRRSETIDLFRIQDFELEEPLFLRLRAAGNLLVRSLDPAEGEIVLAAVPGVHDVYERLRRETIRQRARHKVRLLEGM